MFNLIVTSTSWKDYGHESIELNRVFEYTEDSIREKFTIPPGLMSLNSLEKLPCLFMNEGRNNQVARVGSITNLKIREKEVHFEYTMDSSIPSIKNSMLYEHRKNIGIDYDFEFSRNHWAIKNVDLYRFLLRSVKMNRQSSKGVFNLNEHEEIQSNLLSVMMPFDTSFESVYTAIKNVANTLKLECKRADEIWEKQQIIQDIVNLIDRSRIVICDCSNRNPNVFYEVGIAHTLGREVILITQKEEDVPFDLRTLRHLKYLNNGEGLQDLAQKLQGRITTILES
jgi:hypothetical protein